MAYEDQAKILGREPLAIAEIELDSCSLTFGTAPCTAIGAKCYNTRFTCKDIPNYTGTTTIYRFTDKFVYAPVGLSAFPAVEKVSYSPTKLEFGKGLGYRGKISVTFQDFKHHDRGIDPYQADRTYDTSQGTFFRKLLARNKYYNGRDIRILNGFNASRNDRSSYLFPSDTLYPSAELYPNEQTSPSGPFNFFSEADFQSRHYIIENIDVRNESIVITGKDILKKLDKERSQVPQQSEGLLKADITSVATSLTLTDAYYADYPSSGHIRINDEIIAYSGKTSPDTLTGLTRGQYGTVADSHSTDDTVQLCKTYSSTNVVDIIYDILVNYGDVPDSYIPYDNGATGTNEEWDDEQDTYLTYANYSTIISEPTGANELLEELTEQSMLMLWWDDKLQQVRLKALTPPTQRFKVAELNDSINFLKDSFKYKFKEDDRYSQLWIRYLPNNWSEDLDKEANYSKVYIGANLDSESADVYGDKRIKKIFSRWFTSSSQASTLYTRFSQLYTDAPTEFTFKLDAKDSYIKIGDFVDISSEYLLDTDGSELTVRAFVTEIKDVKIGHEIQVTALSTGFVLGLRYAYVAPNTQVDYTSASEAEKEQYGFIAFDETWFPSDGGDTYRII